MAECCMESNQIIKNDCCLCHKNEATQTNSHIVPSFLGARVFSYDGSGKRGKEVTFTLTASKRTVHTGNLPSTKYEELFDENNLDDNRLEKLKIDSLAKDYYLCPDCEKLLAEYLESPYATFLKKGESIQGDISLFFWLSVIWRVSITRILGDRLSTDTEECMRTYLFSYLEQKRLGQDTSGYIQNVPFKYKILYCSDFLQKDAGFVNYKTNDTHESAAFICGDIAVFMGSDDLVRAFWGLENHLDEAPVNTGSTPENRLLVPIEPFVEAKKEIIIALKEKSLEFERGFLNQYWKSNGFKGKMPIGLQNEIIEYAHGNGLKLGDRGEYELWKPIIFEKITDYFNHHL